METLAVYSFGYAGIKAMHIATLKLVKLQHNDEISISVNVAKAEKINKMV